MTLRYAVDARTRRRYDERLIPTSKVTYTIGDPKKQKILVDEIMKDAKRKKKEIIEEQEDIKHKDVTDDIYNKPLPSKRENYPVKLTEVEYMELQEQPLKRPKLIRVKKEKIEKDFEMILIDDSLIEPTTIYDVEIFMTEAKSFSYEQFDINHKTEYEIFAYCSQSYMDAYEFVIHSWLKPSVKKIYIYTDFDLHPHDSRIEILPVFKNQKSTNWIVGTGRRLDAIKDYLSRKKGTNQQVLFLDMDCYITKDVSHVFSKPFDIGITRLYNTNSYTVSTATAGLWFARVNSGFEKFINDWYQLAMKYRMNGRGIKEHHISYVQYSFTDVARQGLIHRKYNILPMNERLYNSEHSDDKKWKIMVERHKPYILHFKGRRFRKPNLVNDILKTSM